MQSTEGSVVDSAREHGATAETGTLCDEHEVVSKDINDDKMYVLQMEQMSQTVQGAITEIEKSIESLKPASTTPIASEGSPMASPHASKKECLNCAKKAEVVKETKKQLVDSRVKVVLPENELLTREGDLLLERQQNAASEEEFNPLTISALDDEHECNEKQQATLQAVRTERDAAKDELSTLKAERDAAKRDVASFQAERDAARGNLATVNTERDAAKDELSTVKAERDTAKGEMVTLKAERDAARGYLVTVRTERDAAKAELSTVKAELSTVKAERDIAKCEVITLTAERDTARCKVGLVQAERDAANARREVQEAAATARYNDLSTYCSEMQQRLARYRQRQQNENTVFGALRGFLRFPEGHHMCEDLMKNMIRERQDEIAAKDETIHKLQGEKQTLAQKVLNLEQELEETKKDVVRERSESKTAIIQVRQKFQEEKEKLAKIVNDLEQKYKDLMEYVIGERQKEKTEINETIEKLQKGNQTQAQKIAELKQELKLSEEKLQESNESNKHLKCEIDSVVTDRIKIKQEIQGLEKDKKSLPDEGCDLKKEFYAMLLKTEAVAEERDRVTAQLERIQIHNAALLDVINRFQERMQAAGQDDQALRNELHEMDIVLLRVEDDHEVHVLD